jgi:molybdopterin converting factor small subunit
LLFASYADALGSSELQLSLRDGATVADVLAQVKALAAGHALPPAPLVAVNQRYAGPSVRINAGDEVAIIPPVAGG